MVRRDECMRRQTNALNSAKRAPGVAQVASASRTTDAERPTAAVWPSARSGCGSVANAHAMYKKSTTARLIFALQHARYVVWLLNLQSSLLAWALNSKRSTITFRLRCPFGLVGYDASFTDNKAGSSRGPQFDSENGHLFFLIFFLQFLFFCN